MLIRSTRRFFSIGVALHVNVAKYKKIIPHFENKYDSKPVLEKPSYTKIYQKHKKNKLANILHDSIEYSINREEPIYNNAYGVYMGGKLSLNAIRKYYSENTSKFFLRPFLHSEFDEIVLTRALDDENSSDIFIFDDEGCCVFWNCTQEEIKEIKEVMTSCLTTKVDAYVGESETLEYCLSETNETKFKDFIVNLKSGPWKSTVVDKFSASYALVLTILTSIGEAKVDDLLENVRNLDNRKYETLWSMYTYQRFSSIIKNIKTLHSLRLEYNLDYDLLGEPDYLWEYEDQEKLFRNLKKYFEIEKRVEHINCGMNCLEASIKTHNQYAFHHRSSRLEIIIIILIAFEVVVGLIPILLKV